MDSISFLTHAHICAKTCIPIQAQKKLMLQETHAHTWPQNWGNWNAAAGVHGGRINQFNILKQSKDYDLEVCSLALSRAARKDVRAFTVCLLPW
jgi:deoxyribodipyrimidine photolyase